MTDSDDPSLLMYRVSTLILRDPHISVEAPFVGCIDLTDEGAPMGLAPSVNSMISDSITLDDDNDGDLDLSLLMLMNELDPNPDAEGLVRIGDGRCSSPMNATVCRIEEEDPLQETRFTNSTTGSTTCRSLSTAPRHYSRR